MPIEQCQLSQIPMDSVRRIQSLIYEGKTSIGQGRPGEAWQWEGEDLKKELDDLKNWMRTSGHEVLQCNVFHFTQNAQIVRNPQISQPATYLLIVINGVPAFRTGKQLLPNQAYYVDELPMLLGTDWDIVMAALAKGRP